MAEESLSRARTPDTVPTVRELAIVLFRRRKVFGWVAITVFAASVLYAAFGTSYEASMKILVRRGRAETPVSAGENAPLDLTRIAVTDEELNSEVELLQDREVLRKVVAETGAGGRDWFHFIRLGEGPAARIERATRRLAKKVNVEPVKKTNLIAIRYKASDPESAEKVLQSLAKAYIEKHTSVHRPAGDSHFFERQMNEASAELEHSQQQLLRFSESHGSVSAALRSAASAAWAASALCSFWRARERLVAWLRSALACSNCSLTWLKEVSAAGMFSASFDRCSSGSNWTCWMAAWARFTAFSRRTNSVWARVPSWE